MRRESGPYRSAARCRALAGKFDRNIKQQLMIRLRQAEPAELELPHPGNHVAVGVLVQPRGAVGGVGRHVAVQEHDVVTRPQPVEIIAGAGPVQSEQHGHRIYRLGQVAVLAMQRLGCQVSMHRLAIPWKAMVATDFRTPRGGPQPVGQPVRALAGAVEALDHDQHARSLTQNCPQLGVVGSPLNRAAIHCIAGSPSTPSAGRG
jgi:hypothetical protein